MTSPSRFFGRRHTPLMALLVGVGWVVACGSTGQDHGDQPRDDDPSAATGGRVPARPTTGGGVGGGVGGEVNSGAGGQPTTGDGGATPQNSGGTAHSGGASAGGAPGAGGDGFMGGAGGAVDPQVLWYRYFDRIPKIDVDSAGEVIVVDSAAPETDFGCGPMSAPANNPFVLSLNPRSGDCLWSHLTQSPSAGSANAMALTEAGRIVLGGHFKGDTFDLGGGALPNFVATWVTPYVAEFSYGSEGLNHVVSRSFIAQGRTWAVSHGARIAAVSTYDSEATVDGVKLRPCCADGEGTLVVSVENSGLAAWIGGGHSLAGSITPNDILAHDGVVYVTGIFDGEILWGDETFSDHGARDGFIAAFDETTGQQLWTRNYGAVKNAAHTNIRPIVGLPDGTVAWAAVVEGGTNLGAGPLPDAGRHLVIAHMDKLGELLHRAVVPVYDGSPADLVVHPDGGLVVLAAHRNEITLGETVLPFTSSGGNLFVAHLASDWSTWISAEEFLTTSWDLGVGSLAMTDEGTLLIATYADQDIAVRGEVIPRSYGDAVLFALN